MEKLRKQQQLNLEYQKFKNLDEERFRNRFARRKGCQVEQNDEKAAETAVILKGVNVIQVEDNPLCILLSRLDTLQKSVNDLKQQQNVESKHHIDTKSNDISCIESTQSIITDENKSTMIEKAVERLNKLEEIIRTVKTPENHHAPGVEKRTAISPEINKIDLGNGNPSLTEQRLKQIKKEKYAMDLKKQIEEKQRLKEEQRQKELEEDRANFAKLQEHGIIGHQIQNLSNEESADQKQNSSNNRQSGHARGGNGIFGEPLTELQKQANAMYRAELMAQIEERRLCQKQRIREEKEKELAKEIVIDERPKSNKTETEPNNGETSTTKSAPVDNGKHSVCIQVTLRPNHIQNRPKKVTRITHNHGKTQDAKKLAELLQKITQLKVELAAEKVRIQRCQEATEEIVQVYDPRTVHMTSSDNCFDTRKFNRPMKVHRGLTLDCPRRMKKLNSSWDGEQNYNGDISLSSNSIFVDNNVEDIPRSSSMDSLDLDEINRRVKLRFEQLKIQEDLYKNEEPIIQEFMAEEEAKIMAKSGC